MPSLNLPRGYLSASQIGTYQRCPMQYYFRYIRGVITPPGIALLRGTAFHAGFEGFYMEKIAGNSLLTSKQVLDLTVMVLEEEAEKSDVTIQGAQKDSTILDLGYVTSSYIDNIATWVPPVVVEEEVWYETESGIRILGYIDLERKLSDQEHEIFKDLPEVKDGVRNLDDELIVCDYKYTGRKWTSTKLQNTLQFMIYAMATGVGSMEIHNVVEKNKEPKLAKKEEREDFLAPEQDIASNARIVRHTFDGSDEHHVDTTINTVASAISAGSFPPCVPDSWACTPKFCGYWDICRGAPQREIIVT